MLHNEETTLLQQEVHLERYAHNVGLLFTVNNCAYAISSLDENLTWHVTGYATWCSMFSRPIQLDYMIILIVIARKCGKL